MPAPDASPRQPNDAALNRMGTLSLSQWAMIDDTVASRRKLLYTAMFGVVGVVIAAYAGIVQTQSEASNPLVGGQCLVGTCDWQRYSFEPTPLLVGLAGELLCVVLLLRLWRLQRDAGARRVLQSTGVIVWRGGTRRGRYIALASNSRLRILGVTRFAGLYSGSATVAPGRYQLTFLPHTHVLVGAEPLDPLETYAANTSAVLALSFRSGLAELSANRAGQLAESQRQTLRRIARRALLPWVIGVLVLVIWLGATHDIIFDPNLLANGLWILAIVTTLFGLLFMFVIMSIASIGLGSHGDRRRAQADLRGDQVSVARGIGTKAISETTVDVGNSKTVIRRYYFTLGGTRFRIPTRTQYHALITGMTYCAYFAPNSKVLLNFEPVSMP